MLFWLVVLAYIVTFIVQIVLFVVTIRKKKRNLWISLFLSEILPMLTALGIGIYYNIISGPEFAHFFHVLFSFAAAFLYGINCLASIFYMIVRKALS